MQRHITEDAHHQWPQKPESQEERTPDPSEYVRKNSDHTKGWNAEKPGHGDNAAEMKYRIATLEKGLVILLKKQNKTKW